MSTTLALKSYPAASSSPVLGLQTLTNTTGNEIILNRNNENPEKEVKDWRLKGERSSS
jgi:hypothetical protein